MTDDTGRAVVLRQLTERQAAFISIFTTEPGAIGDPTESARRAGYSHTRARDIARQVMALPHVKEAIYQANKNKISGSMLTKAVEVVHAILNDPKASDKLKLEASKTVMDRAGLVAMRTPEDGSQYRNKRPEDMSIDELQDFIRRGDEAMRLAANSMKDVTPVTTLENETPGENEDD
jgi:phage terminase small subunit